MSLYDDLIAFWPMTEGSGNTLASLVNASIPGSARSLNGAIPGSHVTWSTSGNGWTGNGLNFDGDAAEAVPVENFTFGRTFLPRSGLSCACWMKSASGNKPASGHTSCLMAPGWNAFPVANWILLVNHAGQVQFRWWSSDSSLGSWLNQVTGTINVMDGSAHHIAVVSNGTAFPVIYVDGVVDTVSSSGGTGYDIEDSGYENAAGALCAHWDTPYTGTLGPAGVWSRTLSIYEVKTLANAASPLFQGVTYALAGFNPGLTNADWFTTAPAAADLNALWEPSNLRALFGPITWAYVYTLHVGQTIAQAVAAAVAANPLFGSDAAHRGAILIPNGTYQDDAHPLYFDGTVLPIYIDLIGQSAGGVVYTQQTGIYNTGGSGGYPCVHNAGAQLVCHMTLIRCAGAETGAALDFTVSGGVLTSLTVNAGGTGYVDGTYTPAGYSFVVNLTTTAGVVTGVTFNSGSLPGNATYTAVAVQAASRYCIHGNPGPNEVQIYFDLELWNSTGWKDIGVSGASGSSLNLICVTADMGFYLHDTTPMAAPITVMINGCTSRANCSFDPTGDPASFEWDDYGAQTNSIIVRGCDLRGDTGGTPTAQDIYLHKITGTSTSVLTIDQTNVTGAPIAVTLDNAGFVRRDNPGGAILLVNPPLRESAILAAQGLTAAAVVSGQTIDDVLGTGILTPPPPSDVRLSVDRGDGVLGSLVVPSPNDVRQGIGVDGTVGLCYVPPVNAVLFGVQVDVSGVGTLGNVQLAGIAAIDPGTGYLTLTIGDDYLAADNRAVTFTDPEDGTWPATIGSCRLTMRQAGNDSSTQLDVAGTLIAGSPRVVSFDLPHATMTGMTRSAASWDNRYSLTLYTAATYGGHVATVLNDLPATIVAPLAE